MICHIRSPHHVTIHSVERPATRAFVVSIDAWQMQKTETGEEPQAIEAMTLGTGDGEQWYWLVVQSVIDADAP